MSEPEEYTGEPKPRNWPEIREWFQVIIAFVALLVAVVSFWTTTQISGLEDYLRSEVSRRNSELDRLASDTDRVRTAAANQEEQLAELSASADRLVSNYIDAQANVERTRDELIRIQGEAATAQNALISKQLESDALEVEVAEQRDAIDFFRRRRVYEASIFRILFGVGLDPDDDEISGERVLTLLGSLYPSSSESELSPYYDETRLRAARICEPLRSFKPEIPPKQEYPDNPPRYGTPVMTSQGLGYRMTEEEARLQEEAREKWREDFNAVTEANGARSDLIISVNEYLRNYGQRCVCLALATEKHSAEDICPDSEGFPTRPRI
ncbi:MAG: hypothetical protein SXU28_01325 [Pseudomonadota bacterium]|nr:hypothetical protein [Pseudomonadota bacterium]